MTIQKSNAEFNTWVGGLITEASPLNFPENSSLAEDNFVLYRDGSRQRRLGMAYESGYEIINTDVTPSAYGQIGSGSFVWEGAGGDELTTLVVVQINHLLYFFDGLQDVISTSLVDFIDLSLYDSNLMTSYRRYGMSSTGGRLLVVTGESKVFTIDYDSTIQDPSGRLSITSDVLRVRDLFGVEDPNNEIGENISARGDVSKGHIYNVRNQTWSHTWDNKDPIAQFGTVPSNADNANLGVVDDLDNSTGEVVNKVFKPSIVLNSAIAGMTRAPQGSFIIELLRRGRSREEVLQARYARNNLTQYPVPTGSLPKDFTPGGPKAVAEYAGRAWFSGFSGVVEEGDKNSPRLSSYVLFSQLVKSSNDAYACYQAADPTAYDDSEMVATDGGFIRIDGAQEIIGLRNLDQGLAVFANNGVWIIQGGSEYGFKADDYRVDKISDLGCIGPKSIVEAEGAAFFWGESGLYLLRQNQYLDWVVESVSQNTIQTFYQQISATDRFNAFGEFDRYDRKVRWLYPDELEGDTTTRELIYDLNLSAFYTNTIYTPLTTALPLPFSIIRVPAYRRGVVTDLVVDNADELVTANGENVTVTRVLRSSGVKEIKYATVTSLDPIRFTFALYQDKDFRDWPDEQNPSTSEYGADAYAYTITGYITGGTPSVKKTVPRIITHMKGTEDGWEVTGGELLPVNASSCLMSAQWDWTNDARANRWSTPRQIYRYRRTYIPEDVDDTFVHGTDNVVTKHKLRGYGRSLALKFETEEGKDCWLLGWGLEVNSNARM